MSKHPHHLSINLKRHHDTLMVNVKVSGKLTHSDFQTLYPKLEAALYALHANDISLLIDMSEFDGWEWRSLWLDFNSGLKLGTEFDRIALYGFKPWQKLVARWRNWRTGSQIKAFRHYEDAFRWSLAS